MLTDTKDWPKRLKLQDVAAQLAPSIYYARAMAYGDDRSWELLSPELHRSYIDIARLVLIGLAPPNPVSRFERFARRVEQWRTSQTEPRRA